MACRMDSATELAVTQPNTPTPLAYSPTNDDIQLARYAMETLAAVGDRMHVFGLAVNRPEVNFDRSGAVRLEALKVDDSLGLLAFVQLLSATMCMENDALGFNSFFANTTRTESGMRSDLCRISVNIPDIPPGLKNASLELGEVLVRRTSLVGRATLVYSARLSKEGGNTLLKAEGNTAESFDMVIESSWQHVNRDTESDILKELHADARAGNYIVKLYSGWEQPGTKGSFRRTKIGAPILAVFHDRALQHTVVERLYPIKKLSEPFHIRHTGWSVLQATGSWTRKAGSTEI